MISSYTLEMAPIEWNLITYFFGVVRFFKAMIKRWLLLKISVHSLCYKPIHIIWHDRRVINCTTKLSTKKHRIKLRCCLFKNDNFHSHLLRFHLVIYFRVIYYLEDCCRTFNGWELTIHQKSTHSLFKACIRTVFHINVYAICSGQCLPRVTHYIYKIVSRRTHPTAAVHKRWADPVPAPANTWASQVEGGTR